MQNDNTMKQISLLLKTAIILMIATVYAVLAIATEKAITLVIIVTVFTLSIFIIRITLYFFFNVLKWTVILAVAVLTIASIL